MRRMAATILHDDDLAADAVQETFVHLWHRRWRLGMMENPQGFCMRTLRNRCIDILRKAKRRNEADLEAMADRYDLTEPEENTEEIYTELRKALETLPPQQKKVIELKYTGQQSIPEIAKQTGLSETNVSTLLSRAYAALRQQMKKES